MQDLILSKLQFIYGHTNIRNMDNVFVVKRKDRIIKFFIQICDIGDPQKYMMLKKETKKQKDQKELHITFMNDDIFDFFPIGCYMSDVTFITHKHKGKKGKYVIYNRQNYTFIQKIALYYNYNNPFNIERIFNCCYDDILECNIATIKHFNYNLSVIQKQIIKHIFQKYIIISQIINCDVSWVIAHFIFLLTR